MKNRKRIDWNIVWRLRIREYKVRSIRNQKKYDLRNKVL